VDLILISRCSCCLIIPKKTLKKKLNEELKPSRWREATVHHASKTQRPLEVERNGSVTGERDKILDGF
jgi:hypothetical protein